MLQDVINRQEQLSAIESISSPLAAQMLDFNEEDCQSFLTDDIPASDNSTYCPITGNVNDTTSASITNTAAAANGESEGVCCYDLPTSDNSTGCQTIGNDTATNSAPNTTTTTTASCDSEGLCCYLDDDASFDFDPDTISSLLDCEQPSEYEPSDVIPASTAATHQLPATSSYIGQQNQDELNQLLLTDAINSGNWPLDSPDSVIPQDMDTDARPRWVPWPCNNPDRVVQLPEGRQIQMMPSLTGYMGMNSLPTCTFPDTSIISRYQPMCSGDGQMGFFHGRMLMNAEAGMGAEGGAGGVYGVEATHSVYNSIDMQVMGDFKSLVDGCNSSPATLPTSDITPLEDSTLKVGRLSPEERKEKIHRYLKKRTERNFNKKIKYACRKTLADSRPRVRGRFAKNDDHSEGKTRSSSSNHEYYDEEEVVVKEEEDMLNSSNIFTHVSGVNSFNYNYSLESWM